MIRHIALFRFSNEVTPADVIELDAALARIPALVPNVTSFDSGADVGVTDGAWDYAVVAEFASAADYAAYATHPDHVAIVERVVKPKITDAARIQFEV
ncbi:MAG: Dabb family protein [Acidimicrobiia bacterium]